MPNLNQQNILHSCCEVFLFFFFVMEIILQAPAVEVFLDLLVPL